MVASVCQLYGKWLTTRGTRSNFRHISAAVARATEWSETRPAVFRHAVVLSVIPRKFHYFFLAVLVETTCDDVEHTWREQVREESAVRPPHRGKGYAINGCRLGSACKILIKVRYLAKRSFLTTAFFLSLAETNVGLLFFQFLKREFF